ncbi:acyl-CoA dehydrogenase family protein [Azotobacter chroococcum]|uniref:acyl-CoA dehydrogenase family protein n=1 Tax=Azotobacter chroococcum TaxID=353 RepID=UPI00103A5FDA|nr:acyl-CoA dehydrogenase family protein [Azotobacter chroococcum]TBW03221.1 acyl-CoA dehydrogenase [Azotobacter chroococcum]TKD40067.1 acyl-CoA dehydrogenase [Azotobacter chroococcum]
MSHDLHTLFERIKASAVERDARGGHAAAEKALLREAGLLLLAIPRALGGLERNWQEIFALVRRLAAVDSSLAHILAFHQLQVATVLIYGSEEQQVRLLGHTAEHQCWWGNGMNPLDRRLVAEPVAEGFLLDGVKSFCSGTVGAHFMTLSAVAGERAQPLLGVVSTEHPGVQVLDDWDPIGQRQTDSNSIRFTRVPLAARDVLRAADATPSAFHTLRNCFGQLVLTNLYLGIAEGAFAEARDYAHGQARPWLTSPAAQAVDDPFTQNRFGEMHVRIAAGRALAERAAELIDRAFSRGPALTADERARVAVAVAEAKVLAHRAGLFASQELFEVVGARGTRASLGFDRYWRNVRTHTLHDPIDYKLNMLGRWALKDEAPDPANYT